MKKEVQKVFLYDRWFSFINETKDSLIYNSKSNDLNNDVCLEYNKENDHIKLLYFKEGKVVGKLDIIKSDNLYTINYKSLECEVLEKDDDIYVNLLYELNMSIKNQIPQNLRMKLSKKRNLNKICYLEPTFPLDEGINIKNIKIRNDQINYLIDFFNELPYYLPIIYKQIKQNLQEANKSNEQVIKELSIPEEIYMYDRSYQLVSHNDYNLVYENTCRDKSTLKLELNPYETKIKNAILEVIPKNDNEVRDKIEFSHESNGNIIIKYINFNKIRLELNRVACTGKLSTYAEYDNNGSAIRNEIYINSSNKEYKLCTHPVFGSKYLDENGAMYTIANSDYARFHGFQNLICPIVHNVEKQLYKELK